MPTCIAQRSRVVGRQRWHVQGYSLFVGISLCSVYHVSLVQACHVWLCRWCSLRADAVVLQARAVQDGLTFVAPYDDPHTIAGQGTIGDEILRQVRTLTLLRCSVL
jgi:hypothetical protein